MIINVFSITFIKGVFKYGVFRKKFVEKRSEVTNEWRRLYNMKLDELYSCHDRV